MVSVIMPAYNAEKYIADAIRSVIGQTYSYWELLIIDDGSNDHTKEFAGYFEQLDVRIKVYHNPFRLGVAQTRNFGIELARGKWIAFLDSDDIWHREKLQKQLEKAHNVDAQLIYTSYALFSDYLGSRTNYLVPSKISYNNLLKENIIGCSTVLVLRSVLEEHQFSSDVFHEDYALWLELLKAGYQFTGCVEVLTDWRISPSSKSYHKLSSAQSRWQIYRKVEKLSFLRSMQFFVMYTIRGIVKYARK